MTDTTSTTTTTTTTTTTPEVEGFVQKIQTWRTTLTPSEQTMLDTILTTAQRTATTGRTTADVTAYTMTTTTNWTTLGTWLTTTARTPTTTTTTTTWLAISEVDGKPSAAPRLHCDVQRNGRNLPIRSRGAAVRPVTLSMSS